MGEVSNIKILLLSHLMMDQEQIQELRKKVSPANTIHHSSFIYKQLKQLNLCKCYSNCMISHFIDILISIFVSGYHGKTTDFSKNSACHRTTVTHFLHSGKWDNTLLEDSLKSCIIEMIYSEALRSENLFSAWWMIPSLPKQSLRHRICIQSKMRIFTSPI